VGAFGRPLDFLYCQPQHFLLGFGFSIGRQAGEVTECPVKQLRFDLGLTGCSLRLRAVAITRSMISGARARFFQLLKKPLFGGAGRMRFQWTVATWVRYKNPCGAAHLFLSGGTVFLSAMHYFTRRFPPIAWFHLLTKPLNESPKIFCIFVFKIKITWV
jgi:hypothetical protein